MEAQEVSAIVKLQNIASTAIVPVLVASFGENLRGLRGLKFKHSKELAERLDVKPSVVSRWETNGTGPPNAKTLIKLAGVLECSVDQLLNGVDGHVIRAQQDASNVGTQDRVSELEALVTEYRATLSEVEDIAKRLTRIAVFGGEGRKARGPQRKSG